MILMILVLDIYWCCVNIFGLINEIEVNSKFLISLLVDSNYIIGLLRGSWGEFMLYRLLMFKFC